MAQVYKTGRKIFNTLIQYSTLNNLPTGVTKPNVITDLDYIPPIVDTNFCEPELYNDENLGNFNIFSNFAGVKELGIIVKNQSLNQIIFQKQWTRVSEAPLNILEGIVLEDIGENYQILYYLKNSGLINYKIEISDNSSNYFQEVQNQRLNYYQIPTLFNTNLFIKIKQS